MSDVKPPVCLYCLRPSLLVGGEVIYPHRPDLHGRQFYYCEPCEAWVGTHRNSNKPLGRLANAELRRAKILAHEAFDPLWRGDAAEMSRDEAYAWLADAMDMPAKHCHIGHFATHQCRRVARLCAERFASKGARVVFADSGVWWESDR